MTYCGSQGSVSTEGLVVRLVMASTRHPRLVLVRLRDEANALFRPLRRTGDHPPSLLNSGRRIIFTRSGTRITDVLLRNLPGLRFLGLFAHIGRSVSWLHLVRAGLSAFVTSHSGHCLC